MATRKTTAKKASAKKSTAKKSTARKSSGTPRKAGAKRASATGKTGAAGQAVKRAEGTLHNVARSIGSTLGSFAKKTSKAVDAAKNALPFGEREESEQ